MSIELLKKQAEKNLDCSTDHPHWVSKSNKTHLIYQSMINLSKKKRTYIFKAKNKQEFKKKSNYQISVSELARDTGMANTTISHTSAYSKGLMLTLKDHNEQLLKQVNNRTNLLQKRQQRGLKASKKDNILAKLRKTEKELQYVKKLNASDQVIELVNGLSLPVKRKLGL